MPQRCDQKADSRYWLTSKGMLVVLLLATGQPTSAQTADETLTVQIKTISFTQETATALCPKPDETTRRTDVEVNGAVKAEVPGLLKRIVDLGGEVASKYQRTDTQGVLVQDLADLIKTANDCRLRVFIFLTEKLLGGPPPRVVPNAPIAATTPVVATPSGNPAEIQADRPGVPIVRVFPKINLTQRETIALAKMLPTFEVQTGKSEIDPVNYADTLFVNRDKIKPSEVVAVARALARLGVTIKSIQQSVVGGRREIQVGTALLYDFGPQRFEHQTAVDLDKLEKLDGVAFWKKAYNGGEVICFTTIGYQVPCSMDNDGRPFRRPGR